MHRDDGPRRAIFRCVGGARAPYEITGGTHQPRRAIGSPRSLSGRAAKENHLLSRRHGQPRFRRATATGASRTADTGTSSWSDRCLKADVLGEEHGGFAIAGTWLGSTSRSRRAASGAQLGARSRPSGHDGDQPMTIPGCAFKLADGHRTPPRASDPQCGVEDGRGADRRGRRWRSSTPRLRRSRMKRSRSTAMGVMEELPLARSGAMRGWSGFGTSEIQRSWHAPCCAPTSAQPSGT